LHPTDDIALPSHEAEAQHTDNKSLSLSALLGQVSGALKQAMPGAYWVHAEILHIKKDKYCSLELSSDDSSEQKSKVRAVIWQSNRRIIEHFESVTGTALKPGLKIQFQCRVRFHPEYGFSLDITDLDPAYTLGDMEAKLQRIRNRLVELGEFERNRYLSTPLEFCHVAVITPPDAAGLGDFKTKADLLSVHNLCHFDYFSTKFQGEGIVEPFVQTIKQVINKHNSERPYDVLVIIRGGGDKAGLYQLNEGKIARGVCRCPLPVFVGIGHERDKTILDEVANFSFATPSFVIGHIEKAIVKNARDAGKHFLRLQKSAASLISYAMQETKGQQANIQHHAHQQLAKAKQQVSTHQQTLIHTPSHIVQRAKQTASTCHENLRYQAAGRVADYKQQLKHHRHIVSQRPPELLRAAKQETSRFYEELRYTSVKTVADNKQYLQRYHQTITQKPQDMLRSAKQIAKDKQAEIYHASRHHIIIHKQAAQSHYDTLHREAHSTVEKAKYNVHSHHEKLFVLARHRVATLKTNVEQHFTSLTTRASHLKNEARHLVTMLIEKVLLQDPKKILARGFALLQSSKGEPVTKTTQLSQQQNIHIRLNDGHAKATIEEIYHD
jgi:exodeoxyribonuclease VII large subunit